MYKHHLRLQRLRFERWLTEIGIIPWIAYLLIPVLYILFLYLLFHKTETASIILCGLALFAVSKLSEERRVDFLKTLYAEKYIKIRAVENGILLTPFLLALIIKSAWVESIVLLIAGFSLCFWNGKSIISKSRFKLFSHTPFEFTSNFRISFPIVLLIYISAGMGFYVSNYNLSAFCLGAIFFVTMMYYGQQEIKYFIWIYDKTTDGFIKHKILTAWKYGLMIAAPILITFLILAPEYWMILLLIVLSGLANLVNIIIIRYAVYPKEYGLLDSLAIVFGVMAPPCILFTAPYYYKKLDNTIKPYLS